MSLAKHRWNQLGLCTSVSNFRSCGSGKGLESASPEISWCSGRLSFLPRAPCHRLAWAVTIHKSQGLTLDRVVIDAGSDERAMGQLFVALTRVRHPSHVAFYPMPTQERLTTLIARKGSLAERKKHEREVLRGLAVNTAKRYAHLNPPDSARVTLPGSPSTRQLRA